MKALALTLAALLALTGEAPLPSGRYPQAVSSSVGTVQLFSESDQDAPVSGVQIFLSAGLDKESDANSGVAALVAECITRTPVTVAGTTLPVRDAFIAQGGSLQYTVDGSTVHFYAEGRSEQLPALVSLLARAMAAPDFSSATLAVGRRSLATRIGELQENALSVGIEMFRRSYYATSAGLPALGTTTSLALLGSHDLTEFYQQNYKRSGLSFSAVGRTGPALSDALRELAAAVPEGTVTAVVPKARAIPQNAPRIVARRDVGAPIVVIGFAAPSPGSRDFGAMVVLESLLSTAFERTSSTTLGLAERSVGAFYLYDSAPASLVVYVNGTRVDPSMALRELLLVSKTLATKPLSDSALKRFKTQASGQFVMDSVTISDRAYLLGTFASHGLGPDAINAALAAVDKTTPADVQRVAKQYLQRYIVALVLPRQNG
jgi:zinc protease